MEPDLKRLKKSNVATKSVAAKPASTVVAAAADPNGDDDASAYFCDVCKRVLDADEQRFSCAASAAAANGEGDGGPCPDGFDICGACFSRANPVRHEHPLLEVMAGVPPPKIHILFRVPGMSDVLVAPYTAAVRATASDVLCAAHNVRHVLSLMDLDGRELVSESVPVSAQWVTRSMANMCVTVMKRAMAFFLSALARLCACVRACVRANVRRSGAAKPSVISAAARAGFARVFSCTR